MCLRVLYRKVNTEIFEGLAQEAIMICTQTLLAASAAISKQRGPLDGLLFLIKNLLILREQVGPFNIKFITEKILDFSRMIGAIQNLNQRGIFSFTRQNPIFNIIQQGGPQIKEQHIDAKKFVEAELKAACESYVLQVTRLICDPIVSFLTKVTAYINVRITQKDVQKLCNEPFSKAPKIAELLRKLDDDISNILVPIIVKMTLYLDNTVTQGILFKPIKNNILESYRQLFRYIKEEYTDEDRVVMQPIKTIEELSANLEHLSSEN